MRSWILATAVAASLLGRPALAEDAGPVVPRGAVVHLLVDGEDLESVARLYGLSQAELKTSNPASVWSSGESVVVMRPARGWPTHTVRSGETLWRIGKAYGIGVDQLRQANNLNDNTLMPGNVLTLPRAVKPVWTLQETLAATPAENSAETPLTRTASSSAVYGTVAPRVPDKPLGAWVEVRLPDNRRAWAPAGSLVVGSWQPQDPGRVIEVGRSFIGAPYKWGGVDPNGWDCSAFVQEVFRLGGHQVPRLADAQYAACEKVKQEALIPGDLVFFNTDGSGISHVGIYTGGDRFLHASSSRGVVEDSLKDSYFSTRYLGAGRIPAWLGSNAAMTATDDVRP